MVTKENEELHLSEAGLPYSWVAEGGDADCGAGIVRRRHDRVRGKYG